MATVTKRSDLEWSQLIENESSYAQPTPAVTIPVTPVVPSSHASGLEAKLPVPVMVPGAEERSGISQENVAMLGMTFCRDSLPGPFESKNVPILGMTVGAGSLYALRGYRQAASV